MTSFETRPNSGDTEEQASERFAYARLTVGDPLPWVGQRTRDMATCHVDRFAGRYLVLCFYGSAGDLRGRAAIAAMLRHRNRFDGTRAAFFGVSIDSGDETENRVQNSYPGVLFLYDFDCAVSRVCGAFPSDPSVPPSLHLLRRAWIIVDPTLHVLGIFPFSQENADQEVFAFLDRLPPPDRYGEIQIPAPILLLPNVFEPDLCRHLIALYDAAGGIQTGVARDGKKNVLDGKFKRRRDYTIEDEALIRHIHDRIVRRVNPEIRKLFFMRITRMERSIVGCYAAEDGGHFAPHRDNGQGVTAHRRFAVSVNLNGDFDGGEVVFPEYNPKGYKAPPGWAVVFPCAILHAVNKVRKGRRYAFLPFLYDEEGKKIRAENRRAARISEPEDNRELT
jgi:peroxiredoxin/predicted 2-oxoglutarate/Fe(II)-dependent dioxygenase YbiX